MLSIIGCTSEKAPDEPLIRSIRYTVVTATQDVTERVFSGALEAGNESRLAFQVSGRVKRVTVREGQQVQRGQLVAELDPTDFKLSLRETSANVDQAKAQAENAEADYQRVRRLYETQNTSRQALDAARSQRDASKAAHAGLIDTLARLRRQLGYTRLVAPAAGTINTVNVEASEVISGGTVVVVLQAGQALQAALDVPEAFVRYLSLGDSAKIKIAAVDVEVEGSIQEMGTPNAGTGMFPLRVKLGSDPKGARPGMIAEVTFKPSAESTTNEPGFRLPLSAIGEDRDGRFVFVVDGEPGAQGRVLRVSVKTGVISSAGIHVLEGVKEGQRVVTAGVNRIQNALTVKIPKKPSQGEVL